jgi:hypothetical protein
LSSCRFVLLYGDVEFRPQLVLCKTTKNLIKIKIVGLKMTRILEQRGSFNFKIEQVIELESLGISPNKTNERNDELEISWLLELLKEALYQI